MVRTKQMERKQQDSGMQRAEFPAESSQSEDSPDSSDQTEDLKPEADTGNSEVRSREAEPREVEPTTSSNQQLDTQIVLPRHMSVSGMDASFVRYYREHCMMPYLMDKLMTQRGWTIQMINKVIKNCNAAWKTNVAPVQDVRYRDEVDTDEELGPMPCTKDNAGAAVAMVTNETMYMEGVPPTQAGLEARMVAVSKRRGEQDAPMSVARKEPRKPQGGQGRQGARRKGGNLT